jgi:8-oxo-dGTP pyrophosphatase MutT (NUDIX family)
MKHKGAGILYTDGKKVLLLRRSKHVGNKYTWDFPGGKIKKDEGYFKAAKRESIEEIGLFKGKKVYKFDDLFIVFMVRVKKPFEVTLNKEHDVAIWVDLDKVKNYYLHPGLVDNWEHYYKTIKYIFSNNIAI